MYFNNLEGEINVSKCKSIIILVIMVLIIILISIIFLFFDDNSNVVGSNEEDTKVVEKEESDSSYMEEKIVLINIDGTDANYEFTYNEETFKVLYTYDNWKIYDSYKIKNRNDMKKICQALIDIYPIHGKDMISCRTADDMVYEWVQHNIAYEVLPENNSWRNNAKDVDFDPDDQGKNFKEIYEDRTGKNFYDNIGK